MRTYDKKEIDFILTIGDRPILAVEARMGDMRLSPQLERFRKIKKLNFPLLQVINQPGVFVPKGNRAYLAGYDRLMMIL